MGGGGGGVVFFFKQKTAYEIGTGDWSSDVCSSDLGELRQAALKSELAAIKAQLNPHFLYNVFNTINASLPPGSETTREMVSHLADLFRYQLRATKEDRKSVV